MDSSIVLEESISGLSARKSAQKIFRESFLCGNVDKDRIVYQPLKISGMG